MAITYSIEVQPIALQDMSDIVTYVAQELKSPAAASRLAEKLVKGIDSLSHLPFRCPPHISSRPLQREYRKLQVENYLIFFSVSEPDETVTVARVLYAGRELDARLNDTV